MLLQLIRSATMRVTYGGSTFLTDPYLAAKHTLPSFTGASPNPLVDLPFPPEDVIGNIDMVIVSHLHSDHFGPTARRLLSRDLPLLCQPEDAPALADMGFHEVVPVGDQVVWRGIEIARVPGQHGAGEVLDDMGHTSGFVFRAEGEPTVYWAGDTVWCEAIATTIDQVKPEVILTHSNGAVWGDRILIVMDAAQTVAVCRAAPESAVVAIHMEALDHGTVTRATLRAHAEAQGIGPDRLRIPADGDTLSFP